jgi:hypothetical protein
MSLPPPDNSQSIALAWLCLDSQAVSTRPMKAARVLVLKPVNASGTASVIRFQGDQHAVFHAPGSVPLPT